MPSGYGSVYWTRGWRRVRLDLVSGLALAGPGNQREDYMPDLMIRCQVTVDGAAAPVETQMFASYVIITAVTILANAGAAAADLARARFVLANMAELGVPRSWLPPLAVLKGA